MSAGTVPPGAAPSGADGAEMAHEVDSVLADLRRHARQLVAEVAGPVRRVRLRSGDTVLEVEWHESAVAEPGPAPDAPAVRPAPPPPVPRPAAPAGRVEVRSPMVGTFYRAPEPGAAPFVTVGDVVRPGQVVGIVEAMKLMNEVTAERSGRVVEVLVDDGRPVEYDQPLVTLDPA
ncbi:acetyl-CoA carboxylase biotin carboxyl carrier protein [Micromonospora sp. CPCC 205739]|uniref:acetyl-CoA carboxylase biotin carboxyl carrier protein n=2 Tax=unclassified Micromonospora TaxID=2617518 RepID=UPI002FEF4F19